MSDNSDTASSNEEYDKGEDNEKSQQNVEQEAELIKCRLEIEEERERSRHLNEEALKLREELATMKKRKEKVKEETLIEKVDVLLKTLTGATKMEVFENFISLNVSSSAEDLKKVINMIAIHIVNNPALAALCAELCKYQVDAELKVTEYISVFRNALLYDFQRRISLAENIGNSDDEAYKLGIATFIAYSYSLGLVSCKIVNESVYALMNNNRTTVEDGPEHQYNEFNLQCVARMLTTAGKLNETLMDISFTRTDFFKQTLSRLETVAPLCSQKTSFLLGRLLTPRVKKLVQKQVHPRSVNSKLGAGSAKKDNVSSFGGAVSSKIWRNMSKSVEDASKKDTPRNDVPAKEETLRAKVDGLLKSLAENNKMDAFVKFIFLNQSSSAEDLDMVVTLIVNQAVNKPALAPLYAEMCKYQIDYESKMNENLPPFRYALLNYFQRYTIGNLDDMYKYGFTRFLAHTYLLRLVPVKVIYCCTDDLLHHFETNTKQAPPPYDECNLQCVVRMITNVGEMLERDNTKPSFNGKDFLDQTMRRLQRLAKHCSVETCCMCASLAMLRSKKWVSQGLMPSPLEYFGRKSEKTCNRNATKISGDDFDLWLRILDDFCIKIVRTDTETAAQKRAEGATTSWKPPPADKMEGDGWEKMREFIDRFREDDTGENMGRNNVETDDEIPEIDEDMIYLKPWMKNQLEAVDRSAQVLRVDRVKVYKKIRRLENARDKASEQSEKEDYDIAIEKLKKTSRRVSASILANNYACVLELNLYLPQGFKEVNASGDNEDVKTPIVLEENMDPQIWMNEEYRTVEESIGELKDKAMMIYTKIAALEYSSKHSNEVEDVAKELWQMKDVCAKVSKSIWECNGENQWAIVAVMKDTMIVDNTLF